MMAGPAAEVTVPVTITSVGLAVLLGHDATFWVVVLTVTMLKLFGTGPLVDRHGEELTGRRYWRQQALNFFAAIIPPYAATHGLADWLEVTDRPAYYLIAILLTIMGHGLTIWLVGVSKNPTVLIEWIKAWRGNGGGK